MELNWKEKLKVEANKSADYKIRIFDKKWKKYLKVEWINFMKNTHGPF